jgi:hypothetical protein
VRSVKGLYVCVATDHRMEWQWQLDANIQAPEETSRFNTSSNDPRPRNEMNMRPTMFQHCDNVDLLPLK